MAAPLPESDGDLVRLALEGRQDAFSALYERYFPSVFDFVTRLLRNREEAADVAQDTFIKAMEQLPNLKNPDRFKSWIFTIAHRTGLNRIRSSKRTATVGGAVDDDERATMAVADADPGVDPEQMAAIQEATDIVWEAAAGLDERTYAVMDLHVRQGLDSAEIAEVMGVSKGNAYTMVSRMKQSFSKTLSTYLLVRKGRQDCSTLASVIGPNVEQMTPEIRKRADRHVNKCAVCSDNRIFYLEPLKMFAALMLVPVPAGLKAAIWGSVAMSAAGAAGAGTVAASGAGAGAAAGSGAGGGSAGAAGAAAGGQAGTVATIAAAATLVAAVAAGTLFVLNQDDEPPPVVALPETTTTLIVEVPIAGPLPTTTAAPPGATAPVPTTAATTTTLAPAAEAPADEPPPPSFVVTNDSGSVAEDTTLTINVLDNDTGNVDEGSLRVAAAPANGSATTSAGAIRYTPAANFVGSDTLSYSVADTAGQTGTGTVTVTVLPVNDAPLAPGPGSVTTSEDVAMSFDPLDGASDVDGDTLVMSSFDLLSAAGGTLTEGSLVYTPPANFSGTDSFSYTVSDGAASVVVTVNVSVDPVPDRPTPPAGPVTAEVPEDGSGVIDLLAGWSDVDGDALSAVAGTLTTANGATVVIAANGTATYTAPAGFSGVDSFGFAVTDGTFEESATATVTVSAVNDDPVAGDVTFTTSESTTVGTVLGTIAASDPDGDDLTFSTVSGPIAVNASGTVSVGAALDFDVQPTHTATTTVSDGNGGETVVTVTLIVTEANAAPNLTGGIVVVPSGATPGTTIATIRGTDPNGDALTYAIIGGDPEGVFSIGATSGVLTYVADPVSQPMPTSLTVRVEDPGGLSDTATFTIISLDGP